MRNLIRRNLYPQISAGHHNSIRYVNNTVDILYAFRILNLCNHINMSASVSVQELFNFHHVFCFPHKRRCNKIHILFNSK